VCYLSPALMARFSAKLRAELPAGSVVVSNTFALPDWEPETVRQTGGWFGGPVYRYVQGA
ncbi:MAG TPA: SAM-dependent methyltransferase, partial [Nitrospiria bacterium]|nr:SAM-dependent methyltransferase [Nitrospiria bacterium]